MAMRRGQTLPRLLAEYTFKEHGQQPAKFLCRMREEANVQCLETECVNEC